MIVSTRRSAIVLQGRFAGRHQIAGDVKVRDLQTGQETPAYRRVRLHAWPDGDVVAETWSRAADGAYVFAYLAAGTYFVIGFDHTRQKAPVAEDWIASELMP